MLNCPQEQPSLMVPRLGDTPSAPPSAPPSGRASPNIVQLVYVHASPSDAHASAETAPPMPYDDDCDQPPKPYVYECHFHECDSYSNSMLFSERSNLPIIILSFFGTYVVALGVGYAF